MTRDEPAFLSAVCAVPSDNTPRLVYADWLDEHGRHDRAEFIRLQVEIATRHGGETDAHPSFGGLRHGPIVEGALQRREWELLPAQPVWVYLPDPAVPGDEVVLPVAHRWQWRRGFPAAFEFANLAQWAGLADRLRAAAPVEEVRLGARPDVIWVPPEWGNEAGWRIEGDPEERVIASHRDYENLSDEDALAGLLALRWPGLSFALPPEPDIGAG